MIGLLYFAHVFISDHTSICNSYYQYLYIELPGPLYSSRTKTIKKSTLKIFFIFSQKNVFSFILSNGTFQAQKMKQKKPTKQTKLIPKKQTFSCFGKSTCAVSIVARGNSYKYGQQRSKISMKQIQQMSYKKN